MARFQMKGRISVFLLSFNSTSGETKEENVLK